MSKSYTNLIYHIVFATKGRRPTITPERQARLYEYIGGIVRKLGGILLAINGMADHIHILVKLRPDRSVSDVMRDLKANSSGWMHDVFPDASDFSWQRGFGAFTVSTSQVEGVKRYIAEQQIHHAEKVFEDEFVGLLRKNEVEFDSKYLWS